MLSSVSEPCTEVREADPVCTAALYSIQTDCDVCVWISQTKNTTNVPQVGTETG